MESKPHILAVDNETKSTMMRSTKDGRQLTYEMNVLQQPMRARACGAGAKSSADRRPVDPPPIVELKIYEGEAEHRKDITYALNANYFLFATLEHARAMAQPRHTQEQKSHPVLTGTPVAGMVYLERPSPAGYFIFPDLSVRHEGVFRLSFSLYEELKNVNDEDKSEDTAKANAAGDAHVTHRLEVKSVPFDVFSAKKFPGLTESTSLSRMVAEQGCRVRIRRDVRMRRHRDNKSGKVDWEGYEDETAHQRAYAGSDTDPYTGHPPMIARSRSASNASHHSLSMSRRPSLQELQYQHGQQFVPPQTPSQAYPPVSPYGPSPNQAAYQQPPMQVPTMQPPPPTYQPAYQTQQMPPVQPSYYGYAPPAQQYAAPTQYEATSQPPRHSVDYSTAAPAQDWRRASAPQPQLTYAQRPSISATAYPTQSPQAYTQPPAAPQQPAYSQQYPAQPQPTHQPQYASTTDSYGNRPPPLQPIHPPTRAAGVSTPLSSNRPSFEKTLPPLNLPSMAVANKLEPGSPTRLTQPQASYLPTNESNKRSHSSVFNTSYLNKPLRQGARPETPYGNTQPIASGTNSSSYNLYTAEADDDDDGDLDPTEHMLNYRRANGMHQARDLPPYQA
ncbi:hypothetical protein MBLNU230_g8230t1 [Neophaeotheca triangularis]